MSAELLGRRSQTPTSLHTSPRRLPSSRASSRPPSSLYVASSFTPVEITEVELKCQQSPAENHTDRFSVRSCESALITRRGNTIVLKIVTSVQLTSSYVVSLTFVPVHRPKERFGQFRARGIAKGSSELWLSINIPSKFPVGKYHTHIMLSVEGGSQIVTHFHHSPIAVLFNPWTTDCEECIEQSTDIDQYLLADVGDIVRGTVEHKTTLKWEYGQFEDNVLDVALYLLRSLSADECRSAVAVAREVVSKIVTRDNAGVMVCGAGGTGGTHPCRWTGSTVILQKYHRTKTPVRYGHSWVFAGLTISLLRALGLASRPVTCFNAAHYTSKLGVVERHFTTDGELLDATSKDQIWVYHVWVECWMSRTDLGPQYDGWQVLDPTPQDRQSGRYRIGPVPVAAIKDNKGLKKRGFGCEFIVSTVSSEIKYMRVGQRSKPPTLAHVRKDEVATQIVTIGADKTGSCTLLDVSNEYRESSTTVQSGHFPPPRRDCSFEVSCEGVYLGETVTVVTNVCNNGSLLRTVDGRVVCYTIDQTGRVVRRFASMQFTGVISPGQNASVSFPSPCKQYLPALVDKVMMLFFVAVKVRESQQLFLKSLPYQLSLPTVEVDCPDQAVIGETIKVRLKVKNVLTSSLSRVLFLMQAGRLCPQRELSSKRLVLPGRTVTVDCLLRVNCPVGQYTLNASMHCDKLTDIHGHKTINIVNSLQ